MSHHPHVSLWLLCRFGIFVMPTLDDTMSLCQRTEPATRDTRGKATPVHCPCCCNKATATGGISLIAIGVGIYIAYNSHSLIHAIDIALTAGLITAFLIIVTLSIAIVRAVRNTVTIRPDSPAIQMKAERVTVKETITVRETIAVSGPATARGLASPAPTRALVVRPTHAVLPALDGLASPAPGPRPEDW